MIEKLIRQNSRLRSPFFKTNCCINWLYYKISEILFRSSRLQSALIMHKEDRCFTSVKRIFLTEGTKFVAYG